jgi:hypothetical protein
VYSVSNFDPIDRFFTKFDMNVISLEVYVTELSSTEELWWQVWACKIVSSSLHLKMCFKMLRNDSLKLWCNDMNKQFD